MTTPVCMMFVLFFLCVHDVCFVFLCVHEVCFVFLCVEEVLCVCARVGVCESVHGVRVHEVRDDIRTPDAMHRTGEHILYLKRTLSHYSK